MLIDTHCHLNNDQFSVDLELAVARAAAEFVNLMIVVGFDMPSSVKALELAQASCSLYASVGVHPHDASGWCDAYGSELKVMAAHQSVCAIGEIGLDYYRNLSPQAEQEAAFREQLRIARDLGLPVIIHCRDAYADTLKILRDERVGEFGGVMHCWAGSVEDAQRTLELGMYLGFGGTVTYKSADNVRASLATAPLDSVLLETDAPYLTPTPHRGKRNEPAYIRLIANAVSAVRNIAVSDTEAATTANALRCFPRLSASA